MAADPATWTVVAAVSQLVAAVAAVGALIFVGLQLRASQRTIDIQVLQEFTNRSIEREAAFLNSVDGRQKEQAFIELLNFLESNAAAFNAGLFLGVSRKIVRDSLISSIAAIQLEAKWCGKLLDAVRTATTFAELRKFIESEKKSISIVTAGFTTLRTHDVQQA